MRTVRPLTYKERASQILSGSGPEIVDGIANLIESRDEWARHHRNAMKALQAVAMLLPDPGTAFQQALESAESDNE